MSTLLIVTSCVTKQVRDKLSSPTGDRAMLGGRCFGPIKNLLNPPGSNEKLLSDHLYHSLTTIELNNSNCGIIIDGDFNRLDTNFVQRHFKLKQLVKSPTRGEVILDLVLINLQNYYSPAEVLSPFGLSDHNTVFLKPKIRTQKVCTKKTIIVRDATASNKTCIF